MNKEERVWGPDTLTPAEIEFRTQISERLADAVWHDNGGDRDGFVLPAKDGRLNPYAIAIALLASVSAAEGGTMPSLRADYAVCGIAAEVTVPRLRLGQGHPLLLLLRHDHVYLDMEPAPRGVRVTLRLSIVLEDVIKIFDDLRRFL